MALAVITIIVFWPVWHNGFVEYDDDEYITQNPTVQAGWTWNGLIWAFAGIHSVNYHPLTWLSHMTDCQFFGLHAGAHHLESVVIHAVNAALLWWLLDSLTGRFWRSGMVAAIFALHPLRVESVAWAAERKDVLCAFFFLLTLLAYLKHVRVQKPDVPIHIGQELRTAVFWYFLALLSKAMVVTLPFLLLLIDFWPLHRMTHEKKVDWRVLLWEKLPFFFLSLAFGLVTFFAQRGLVHPQPLSAWGHVAAVATDFMSYMKKMFWPEDLSFLYIRPEHVPQQQEMIAVALMVVISVVALAGWRRWPWLFFGWAWFVVMLLPVTVLTLHKLSIADRYTYLPGIGFTMIVVWSVVGTVRIIVGQRFRPLFAAGAAAILIYCGMRTREQIGYWHDTGTLAEHALAIDPNNDVAQQLRRIYQFEQDHPGVREGRPYLKQ